MSKKNNTHEVTLSAACEIIRACCQAEIIPEWLTYQVMGLGEVASARYGTFFCRVHKSKLHSDRYVLGVSLGTAAYSQADRFESREAAQAAAPALIGAMLANLVMGQRLI